MFETVNALSKRLPTPVWTEDPWSDCRAQEQSLANARALRSEAMASMGRSMIQAVRSVFKRITSPIHAPTSHQT